MGTAFDPGPELARFAFQAVMRDDAEVLRALFDSGGVPWDAKNGGGQTLLEIAMERQKPQARAAIEAAREAQQPMIEERERRKAELLEERERKTRSAPDGDASGSAP